MHNKSVLRNSFFLIFTFMIVEAVFGFVSNSLALISDAFHMLSDAAALFLSLVAFKIAEKRANLQKTFGYKRVEIIAAFINAIALIALAVFVVDTQVFANIYAKLAVNVIMNEKQNAKDDSAIIARVALSREFVNFFETHFPMFFTSVISIIGSAFMLILPGQRSLWRALQ